MKKVLVALLLATVVSVTLTAVLYKDAISTMIDIGTAWLNGETPDNDKPSEGVSLKVKSIEVDTSEVKLDFKFGEKFSYDGLKVIAKMADGTTKEIDPKDCRIVSPNMGLAGIGSVRVFYENFEARYEINIAKRVIPVISATPLASINASKVYRVEAEAFDMNGSANSGDKEGFVDSSENASSGKFITGFNVPYNYFGFTFTASEDYNNATVAVRLANRGTENLVLSDVFKIYLNYNDGEGEISLSGHSIEPTASGEWVDLVLRNVTIPAGTNTLTFDILSGKKIELDFVDLYAGVQYLDSNSKIELNEGDLIVKDIETLDIEKAFTRQDVADAYNLKPGELRIETPGKKETTGKPTNNGTSVAAIGNGSQITTVLSVAEDATVLIRIRASKTDNNRTDYYVADHWNFYIDGVKLMLVERNNILGGNQSNAMYWDWMYTKIGAYNLSAGNHLFMIEAAGVDCNIDTFEFEVLSYGEYAQIGSDLNDQHMCESVCPTCGKCLDTECEYTACLVKCSGNCEYDIYIDNENNYRVEAEDLATDTLKPDSTGNIVVEERPHVTGLGHIATGGFQTFTVKSTKDTTVALSISFANALGGSILKFIPGVSVNGHALTLIDSEVPAGVGSASNYDGYYWNLATIKLAVIELKADTEYTFKIMVNNGNLDAYMLDVVDEEGQVVPDELIKTKLATVDNTNNEMITFVKTNTFYIEFDRHKNADGTANTVYDEGVDYVRYYMYRDFEGAKQLVSWFDITKDGYLITYNGTKISQQLLGGTGNFFSTMGNGTIHNAIKDSYSQGAAANGLTVVWNDDNVVYFACQARTNSTDLFEHGEIGTMGKGWGTI